MSDEKINDAKEKAQAVVEETAQKAKNIFKRFVEKLDEYYNKLPLDKINEKLGGKIDVKSQRVKLVFFAIIGILLLVISSLIFCGSGDVKLSAKELERANEVASIYHKVESGLKQIKYIGTDKSSAYELREFEAVGIKDNGETVKFKIIVPQGWGFDEQAIEVVRK